MMRSKEHEISSRDGVVLIKFGIVFPIKRNGSYKDLVNNGKLFLFGKKKKRPIIILSFKICETSII